MAANVSQYLDFLVIETYTELGVVLLTVAVLATAARLIWRRNRTISTHNSKPTPPLNKRTTVSQPVPPVSSSRASAGLDFDKLASMISDANDRAGHISKTQSAAALKLDTAEVAVNRLLAEIDGIMTLPSKSIDLDPIVATAATTQSPVQSRSSIAA